LKTIKLELLFKSCKLCHDNKCKMRLFRYVLLSTCWFMCLQIDVQ